ncbi:MAG: hypothetical protein AB7I19_19450 [Planctomycetota bacterium]
MKPIPLTDLALYLTKKAETLPLVMSGRVVSATGVPPGAATLKVDVQFHDTAAPFALVRGGVLPSQLPMLRGASFVLDRNVLSMFRKMGGPIDSSHSLEWLNSEQHKVNAIWAAFELPSKQWPSRSEFEAELRINTDALRRCLPRAQVIEFAGASLDAVYGMARSFEARATREAEFLRAVTRILADPVAEANLVVTEQLVLDEADKARLKRRSVVVFVALAKLYEGKDDRPVGEMLKLGRIRSAGCDWQPVVYNVLADIRQIELMAVGQSLPDSHVLLTGDHGLVKVWCGLRPTAQPATHGPATFEFEPDPALFPRLSDLGGILGRLDVAHIDPG